MANIHEHAVLSDVLERKGSGFTARHGDDFLMANNAQWIGFSLEIGPDGALYVLDWHDADICGADVLHQETGRIFRIAPTQSLAEQWPGRYSDLRDDDRRRARRAADEPQRLARAARARHPAGRAASGTLVTHDARSELLRMFTTDDNPDWRLRAMWALHVTGGWTPDALDEGARRPRRIHPRLGDSTALRGRSPSPKPLDAVRADGARRSLAGRAALSRVGAAAPRSRRALERSRAG